MRYNPYLDRQKGGSGNPYMEQVLRIPIPEKRKETQSQTPSTTSSEVDFTINQGKNFGEV